MAFNYIYFDSTTKTHGRMLKEMLTQAERSDELMADVVTTMTSMLSGDGSNVAHFDEVTSRFGFTDNAKAKQAWDELNSSYSKISGNGSVTNVRAARDQMFNYFRG